MAVVWRRLTPFLVWATISLLWASVVPLATRQLLLLAQALLLAGALAALLRERPSTWHWFCGAVVVGGVLEAALGSYQFLFQQFLGLSWLGEPPLDLLNPAVAKTIVVGGGRLLRAYGTFPHPNVLAAFLLLAVYSLVYFWHTTPGRRWSWGYSVILFILLMGLLLTFSRAAWITGGLILGCWLGWMVWRRRARAGEIIVVAVAVVGLLTTLFSWVIIPKLFPSWQEPSLQWRRAYLGIGVALLRQHPFIGVGLGNQTFTAVEQRLYQKFGLVRDFQWQPVHNLYLLVATELGFIGLLLLVVFIALTGRVFIRSKIPADGFQLETVGWMWVSLLLLGLFDHFLWTLPVGLLMFWSVALLTQAVSPRSSMDRT